jgi:hypothetical protein
VIAVTVAAITIWPSGEQSPEAVGTQAAPATTVAAAAPASEGIFTADELVMMDLANRGYIPRLAVDWELMKTKDLVARGIISPQALDPYIEPGASLFTAQERLMMSLVNQGLLPKSAVDQELLDLKRLVNQGFVPKRALEPGG